MLDLGCGHVVCDTTGCCIVFEYDDVIGRAVGCLLIDNIVLIITHELWVISQCADPSVELNNCGIRCDLCCIASTSADTCRLEPNTNRIS